MKKLSKLLALVLAVTMVFSLAGTALAESTTESKNYPYDDESSKFDIKLDHVNVEHTYYAYQIFKGDLNITTTTETDDSGTVTGKTEQKVLSNVQWGDGLAMTGGDPAIPVLLQLLRTEGTTENPNPYYADFNAKVEGKTDYKIQTATDVAAWMNGKDETFATEFVHWIAKQEGVLSGTRLTSSYTEPVYDTQDASKIVTDGYAQFKDVKPGYYLINEDIKDLVDDAHTSFLLQVVGNINRAPKSVWPTVDKQVWDEAADDDRDLVSPVESWGETADHNMFEEFDFKLTAVIPADQDMKYYDSYDVIFHDSFSEGVTFDRLKTVVITAGQKTITLTGRTDMKTAAATGDQYTVAWENAEEDRKFAISVPGLDKILSSNEASLVDGCTITVTYTAHLNEKADVEHLHDGSAQETTNENAVYLEYSNEPNVGGTGKTHEDSVWVFTYDMPNFKYYMESGKKTELEGAGFTLYKAEKENGVWKQSGKPVSLEAVMKTEGSEKVIDYYQPYSQNTNVTSLTEMLSGADGKFLIKGLDDGAYFLVETKTPAGFNTCDPVLVIIDAHTPGVAEGTGEASFGYGHHELTTGTMKNEVLGAILVESVDQDGETVNVPTDTVNILNQRGVNLPETGGVGTTLFYVLGGLMVIGAAVLLITKKRVNG